MVFKAQTSGHKECSHGKEECREGPRGARSGETALGTRAAAGCRRVRQGRAAQGEGSGNWQTATLRWSAEQVSQGQRPGRATQEAGGEQPGQMEPKIHRLGRGRDALGIVPGPPDKL